METYQITNVEIVKEYPSLEASVTKFRFFLYVDFDKGKRKPVTIALKKNKKGEHKWKVCTTDDSWSKYEWNFTKGSADWEGQKKALKDLLDHPSLKIKKLFAEQECGVMV